jgi:metal-responsive CopG/Arc/MetJ family transcriptional regulator
MISLPDDLLERVDRAADDASMSRSAFIRDALLLRLTHRVDIERRRDAMDALRRSFARGDWIAEDVVRTERDR